MPSAHHTRKKTFLLLLIILGLSCQLYAQIAKGIWQLGIGGGANISRYDANSFSTSVFGYTEQVAQHRPSMGFQGYVTANYQLKVRLQACFGLGLGTYKTYTTIHDESILFLLGTKITTDEIVEQRFGAMELPFGIRFHAQKKNGASKKVKLFLEFGGIIFLPIFNDSKYQKSTDGNLVVNRKIRLKPITTFGGIGVTVGNQNAIMLSYLEFPADTPSVTNTWKLTFTRFFNTGITPS